MDSKWKRSVDLACTKLLVELDIIHMLHLPYAIPYMNYVMSWKDHLPIKTIIIGQNPYPQNIYPLYGAALSYDDALIPFPPRSVIAVSEDLYTYDQTPTDNTIECMKNSWHLLNNSTIMINETVLSMIYDEAKGNCRPNKEMEAQSIALQSVITASYFMGQEEVTILGMGESAALMMDQLKKWCPSNVIKMKAVGCRNPAARERGDLLSHAFTLNQKQASKILSAQVAWYQTMPPKKNYKDSRLEQTQKSLENSLDELDTAKNNGKTELNALTERLKEMSTDPVFASCFDKLEGPINNVKKAMIGFTNATRSQTMQLTQFVNAAKESIGAGGGGSDSMGVSTHKNISKLALNHPPRKKVTMTTIQSSPTVPNIEQELKDAPPEIVKGRTIRRALTSSVSVTPSAMSPSIITPSGVTPSVAGMTDMSYMESKASDVGTVSTPSKKKKNPKSIGAKENVHARSFATWFRDNVQDPFPAESLETMCDNKKIGDSTIENKVIEYIRYRKNDDPMYDAHVELHDNRSTSYKWAISVKEEMSMDQ